MMFIIVLFYHIYTLSSIKHDDKESLRIENTYVYFKPLLDSKSIMVRNGNNIVVSDAVSDPKTKIDPGVIFLESFEFNVFYLRFKDGYMCSVDMNKNEKVQICKNSDDINSEWSLLKINDGLQIRSHKNGLCLSTKIYVDPDNSTDESTLILQSCLNEPKFSWIMVPFSKPHEYENFFFTHFMNNAESKPELSESTSNIIHKSIVREVFSSNSIF